ncbi:MAG: RND efflux system outer membrane lipoprotein [Puniceicoccaceae bacterium 5H]|nr:MAG: RND efflux system outer membrane lipoprotein [Puniceicoccaceae bacterium 5H]
MKHWILFLPIIGLAGCSMAPDYQAPQPELPAQLPELDQTANAEADATLQADQTWWTAFGDAQLNAWVERALANNDSAEIAAARVREARALLGQSTAELFPSLNAQGEAARQDSANDLAQTPGPYNTYQLSGVLSYELDLWGRLRNGRKAAREQLLSTTYAYQSTRQTLISDTVTAYFNVIAARIQVEIGEATVADRKESLRLQQLRFDNGAITELERQQAEAEYAAALTSLPDSRENLEVAENALLMLAGANPEAFWSRDMLDQIGEDLPQTVDLEADLTPLALLRLRPDVQAAEADAKAATYNIGVIKAQRWPSLSLSALLGTGATDIDRLFTRDSRMWSVSGSLAGPLFDFGRTANRVRASEAQQEQALLRYEQVVKQAFREVRENWRGYAFANERVDAAVQQATAYDRTVELAQTRYDEGYTSFLELLDARRAQYDSRLALTSARLTYLVQAVDLIKALGGGLEPLQRDK